MAPHLLVIDANLPGIDTIAVAKRRGLRVSFIRSAYRKYPDTAAVRDIVYAADGILSIDNSADDAQLYGAARALHAHRPVDAAVCLLDPSLDAAATVCARLGIPFTAKAAVAAARDKARARRILQRAGLRSLRFSRVATAAAARAAAARIARPVVVKPQTGYDSLLAGIATSADAARRQAAALLAGIEAQPEQLRAQLRKGILVEEYLSGPLLSAEIGMRHGRCHRFMLSEHIRARQDECIEIGAAMPADLSAAEAEACYGYAEAAVRALGLDLGIFHIEMILTAAGPVLVDANARLMGGIMPALYHSLTGEDIQERLLDIHLGLPLPPGPAGRRGVVAACNLLPAQDGRLPERLDLSWLGDFSQALTAFDAYCLQPGRPLRRLQTIASFQIRATAMAAARAIADAILQRCQDSLQIALMR